LKKENFLKPKYSWKEPENRRIFFDKYARSRNFNPLVAENWYSVSLNEIRQAGGRGLLDHHKGSHIKALAKLYPELILKKENFLKFKEKWNASENRRKLFAEFPASKKQSIGILKSILPFVI